jgi:hypothetical protein
MESIEVGEELASLRASMENLNATSRPKSPEAIAGTATA